MATQIERKWLGVATPIVIGPRMPLSTSLDCFSTFFGVAPFICELIWEKIALAAQVLDYNGFSMMHLLWGLHFMRVYGSEKQMATTFRTTPKTFRKWAKLAIKLISWQKVHVVSDTIE